MIVIRKLPATEKRSEGKYIDLGAVRKIAKKLNIESADKIISFIKEYKLEFDMNEQQTTELLKKHFQ